MEAANKAFDAGDHSRAEEQLNVARREAEQFRPKDPRLAVTLTKFSAVYRKMANYTDAERLLHTAVSDSACSKLLV
jgi:hypothetical protein